MTPDQRLRVFVSSTLQELAAERTAAGEAIESLRLIPVLFELGARPHPPQALYRAYLEQSHVFVGIYWQSYGWVAPGAEISGIEDEYRLSSGKPRLVYVKEPADERDPRLAALLERLRSEADVSYKTFESASELHELIAQDLALLMTERFHPAEETDAAAARVRALPAQTTTFVGRTDELAAIDQLLGNGAVRLLTLTGPGGIGKTRLAVEAAGRLRDGYPDGVAFVPLEGLESPELVPGAVASALGIREGSADPLNTVTDYLLHRTLLLLLDNFEHVIAAAVLVARLLEAAPRVRVMVTSRELLRVRGEHELRVPPLAPDAEATVLFAERAGAARHAFELRAEDLAVAGEICRRLDGVPLAIELAAPRLRLLAPDQLLESLDERLVFEGPRDAPARQRTLQAAIGWSYDLLQPRERSLFEGLSVFRGSFTLESARATCDLPAGEVEELVGSLLDKSMVYRLSDPATTRFGMLSMLREFAYERLVWSGERDRVLERLTGFYVAFAVEAEQGIRSSAQRTWKRLIDLEADTLRAELGWLAEHGRGDELVTLLRALWLWYWLSGQLVEGRTWVRRTLPLEEQLAADQRAWLVCLDGLFAFFQVELELAGRRLAQARSLFEDTGDRRGLATVLTISGFATGAVAGEAAALEQLNEAYTAFEGLGDDWGMAGTLGTICRIQSIFGRYEGAGELFAQNVAAAERVGDDLLIALALTNLADYSFAVGETTSSRRHVDRALGLLDVTGIRYSAPDLLEAYARVEAHSGAHARAAELVGAAEVLRETMRVPLWGPLAERQGRFIEDLRSELGADRFGDLRLRGRELPLSHWLVSPTAETA